MAIGLSAVMMTSLAACGGKTGSGGETSAGNVQEGSASGTDV